MYRFIFQRDINGSTEEIEFPLAPKQFKTVVGNKNKTYELVSVGEVNVPKDIGLRTFTFEVLLPKNDTLVTGAKYYVDDDEIKNWTKMQFKEPIWYLNRLRELKAKKAPFFLIIIRQMRDGYNNDGCIKIKQLFGGNLKVTLETYTVEENAGEEGDFWVSLTLKEYREVGVLKKLENTGKVNDNGKTEIVENIDRKDTMTLVDTYTVQKGDTLWGIAKKQLNDGSMYSYLSKINKIEDPNSIKVGQVLKLKEPEMHEPTISEGSFTATSNGNIVFNEENSDHTYTASPTYPIN